MSEIGPHPALRMYNDGVTAVQEGNESQAEALWERALLEHPPRGLEAKLRYNLMLLLTSDLRDLTPRTEIDHEQAARLKTAEAHMIRLNDLCADGADGPVGDLNPETIDQLRQTVRDINLPLMMGRGYWVLPDGETAHRMADLGGILADSGQKDRAIKILTEALPHVQPSRYAEHKELAIRVHFRLAALLNDVGRKEESVDHARKALSAGLTPEVNLLWYEAANLLLESAGQLGEEDWRGKSSTKSGCFIATAAYGSPDAPDVRILRRYRDRVLLRMRAGRLFVRTYYIVSPPIATFLGASPRARKVVLKLLKPIVRAASGHLD